MVIQRCVRCAIIQKVGDDKTLTYQRPKMIHFRTVQLSKSRAVVQNIVDGAWDPPLAEFKPEEEIKVLSTERRAL